MAVLLRLAPWIFYAVGINVGGRQDAALFAAITAAVIIAVSLLRGSRPAELNLDGSTTSRRVPSCSRARSSWSSSCSGPRSRCR